MRNLFFTFFISLLCVNGQENMLPCASHKMTKKEFDKNPERYLKNKHTLDSITNIFNENNSCLLYTSPSPRDQRGSGMPWSA